MLTLLLHIASRGPIWVEGRDAFKFWKALLSALSWQSETSHLSGFVRNVAATDAFVDMLTSYPVLMREHYAGACYIFARGLCVVRSTNPGIAKASDCGTGNRYRPCAFLFSISKANEKGPAATISLWKALSSHNIANNHICMQRFNILTLYFRNLSKFNHFNIITDNKLN